MRSTYLDSSSENFIIGIQSDVAEIDQLLVRADAGGEGATILNSVYGLLQGLFPPTTDNNITLANGTTVVAPLGGYQYIPVESVEPDLDVSLEGFTSCPVSLLAILITLYSFFRFRRTSTHILTSFIIRVLSCRKLPSLNRSWKNYSLFWVTDRSILRTWYVSVN